MRNWNLITKMDGIDTREYDVYQRERVEIPTAEQDTQTIDIKGRDGSLTRKYGFKDIPFPMEFFYYEKGKSFKSAFRSFKQKFMDAKTLIVNEDEGLCHKIKSMQINSAINDRNDIGEFSIDFVLDPFAYELSNEPIIITSPTNINNDGYTALPTITATVAGTGKIYIGEQEVTVKDVNGDITIDSTMQNAYREGSPPINMNKHMIGKFPVLENGNDQISFDGDISKLVVVANRRWR